MQEGPSIGLCGSRGYSMESARTADASVGMRRQEREPSGVRCDEVVVARRLYGSGRTRADDLRIEGSADYPAPTSPSLLAAACGHAAQSSRRRRRDAVGASGRGRRGARLDGVGGRSGRWNTACSSTHGCIWHGMCPCLNRTAEQRVQSPQPRPRQGPRGGAAPSARLPSG